MKLFPSDDDVEIYKSGFDKDILDRKRISAQLSQLVEKIEDPVVFALDGGWGSGKSHFLKRWVGAHILENNGSATTIYFDAFQHDYLADPLVSIVTAVSERLEGSKTETIKNWKKAGAKLIKPVVKVGLSMATFGATEHLSEAGDVLVEAVSAEAGSAVDKLWGNETARQNAMTEFRENLRKLTEEQDGPIVIVVDELDRCRPDYALEVLEIIKHFFTVPRVHFILGVNLEALQNSVKARYGVGIDAENYLNKFIGVSFSLPRRLGRHGENDAISVYANSLAAEMDLPREITYSCIQLFTILGKEHSVSLRDVGKVFSKIVLLPEDSKEMNWMEGYRDVLCLLIVTSVIAPSVHRRYLSGRLSLTDIMAFLGADKANISKESESTGQYNRELADWTVKMAFTCCPSEIEGNNWLPDWSKSTGNLFDSFGRIRDPSTIPNSLQSEFVDTFKTPLR